MSTSIDQALERVPHYQAFRTVDEMFQRARAVAAEHPAFARYREVGHSSDGEAIPMVSIGDGPTQIMLFACPHPNEPIGAMLIQFLLDELVSDEDLRRGRTWHLLPCVDPDGTRLNEGWFGGPFTIRNYARHFYRPRSEEQAEWTFPLHYKQYSWDTPIPETQALMNAFSETRPGFVYSLHNAGFGGVYYYISRDLQAAFPDFRRIPEARGLFMALGEPEMPWAKEYAPAVYQMVSVRDAYDYYEQFGTGNPADLITAGGSSFDFLQPLSDPVMLITELPYFQSPEISDGTRLAATRGQVILEGLAKDREVYAALRSLVDETEAEMTLDNRFLRASATFIRDVPKGFDSKEKWALETPGMDEPATVAQRTGALYVSRFYTSLIASMFRRAIEIQRGQADSPTLAAAQARLEGLLDGWIGEIEANLEYSSIPIRDLVQVQYGAMLAALRELAV